MAGGAAAASPTAATPESMGTETNVKRELRGPGVHGPVDGVVVSWNRDEGWGVVEALSVDGQVWTHFSHILIQGYKTLEPGQRITFTYETPGQDGYPHRALSVEPR